MYRIPNMKLDKKVIQYYMDFIAKEGIKFIIKVVVGKLDIPSLKSLQGENDIIIIVIGVTVIHDLPIPNCNLNSIYFAMQFLYKNIKSLLNTNLFNGIYISVKDKHVIVIGGGDTGNDCIKISVCYRAKSITNFKLLP